MFDCIQVAAWTNYLLWLPADAIYVVRRLRACEEVKKEVQQDYAENEEESQQELQEGYFEAFGDQPCPSYVSKSEGMPNMA